MSGNFLNKPQHYYSEGSCKRFPNGRSHQTHIVSLSVPTKPRQICCIVNGKPYNKIEYRPDQDELEFNISIFDREGKEIWYEKYLNNTYISYKTTHHKEYNDSDITTKIVMNDNQQNVQMTEYILQFGWIHEKQEFIRIMLLMGGKIVE
jgi:hypothetical protein